MLDLQLFNEVGGTDFLGDSSWCLPRFWHCLEVEVSMGLTDDVAM